MPCITSALRSILLLLYFRDDPPCYYVMIGDKVKAEDVLRKLYFDEHVAD